MPYNSNAKIQIVDSSGDPCDSDAGKLNVTVDGTVDLGSTATNHLSEIEGAVETMESQGVISNSLLNLMNTGLDNIEAPFIQVSRVLGLHTYSEGSSYAFTVGAVRNDTLAALAGTDNEFAPLQVNASGALYVEVASSATLSVNSHAVTNAGTFATQIDGDALTSLQLIDDAIYADDADFTLTSNKGIPMMGYATSHRTITDGDVGVISLTTSGNVRTTTNQAAPDTFAMIDVDNASEALADTIGVFTTCVEIFLQADESNSGYIMVGDSDVADNRGMKLNAGDTLILNGWDTRQYHLWGSASNQNLRCMITKAGL